MAWAAPYKLMPDDDFEHRGLMIGPTLDKGGAIFNAKAFGAKGDGATDDTVAIQAAATACNTFSRAGKLYFPPGTYKTTASITIVNCDVGGSGLQSAVIAPTTAVAGSPAIIFSAPSNGGQLRQGKIHDLSIVGPSSAPTLGLHPSSLVDCLRIDNPTVLERVRVTNCDKGFNENASSGHITYYSCESTNNYYAVYKTKQGGAPGNDGGDSRYFDCNFQASYAVIGVANDCVVNGMTAIGGTWGSTPYVMWQEASGGTGALLTTVYFQDVHFENIGNGAMGVGATAGGAGSINNLTIINPGYVSDVSKRLLTASCASAGSPYQCCTGAAAGCDPAYAIDVGGANGTTYLWQGLGSIVGTTGVLRSTSCTGEVRVHRQNAVAGNTTFSCAGNPSFVNYGDGHGGWQWTGNTPTDTPVACVSGVKGWQYFDASLGEMCTCNGSTWCKAAAPAVCGSSSSCDATSGATGTVDGITEGRRYFGGAPAGVNGATVTNLYTWGAAPSLFLLQAGGSGGPAPLEDATGFYADNVGGAMANQTAGLTTSAAATTVDKIFSRRLAPIVSVTMKTGADITQQRTWVGLSATTHGNLTADTPALSSAIFRFSTNVPDTKWQAVTTDGTTPTVVDTGITVVANTRYVMKIDLSVSGNAIFSINGAVVATITTNLPLIATLMNLSAVINPTGAVNRNIRTGAFLASAL